VLPIVVRKNFDAGVLSRIDWNAEQGRKLSPQEGQALV